MLDKAQLGPRFCLPAVLICLFLFCFLFTPELLNQFFIRAAERIQDCLCTSCRRNVFTLKIWLLNSEGSVPHQLELVADLGSQEAVKGKQVAPQVCCPEVPRTWLLGNLPRICQFSYPVLMEQNLGIEGNNLTQFL